jgi:hypothetical protein
MSGLRDEIRSILREEIAALKGGSQSDALTSEAVRIKSNADLARFAQDLLTRAQDPAFAARVKQGSYRFELEQHQLIGAPIVLAPAKPKLNVLTKTLVTERDIGALSAGTQVLSIGKTSRLTPLARDEARRRGIRIERSEV